MNDRLEGQVRIRYHDLCAAVVTDTYRVDGKERRLYVDAQALDGRGAWRKIPVLLAPGIARNYRKQQVILLGFRGGSANHPVVLGHLSNTDRLSGDGAFFGNPLAPKHDAPTTPLVDQVDDLVFHHDETGAFIRFRNTGSPGRTDLTTPAQPALLEFTLASGATMTFTEHAPSAGAAPTSADYKVLLPSGAFVEILEPQPGQATCEISMPSGATATCDVNGVWTFHSPQKVVVNAPDVEIGSDTGQSDGDRLARKSDVEEIRSALNAAITQYNGHTHQGHVPTPNDAPEVMTQASEPPYSTTTFST